VVVPLREYSSKCGPPPRLVIFLFFTTVSLLTRKFFPPAEDLLCHLLPPGRPELPWCGSSDLSSAPPPVATSILMRETPSISVSSLPTRHLAIPCHMSIPVESVPQIGAHILMHSYLQKRVLFQIFPLRTFPPSRPRESNSEIITSSASPPS